METLLSITDSAKRSYEEYIRDIILSITGLEKMNSYTDEEALLDLKEALSRVPGLAREGLIAGSDINKTSEEGRAELLRDLSTFKVCMAWIALELLPLPRLKTAKSGEDSYALKHRVEKYVDLNSTGHIYVSNGIVTLAMVASGFKYQREGWRRNMQFNVSRSRVNKIQDRYFAQDRLRRDSN